MKTLVKVVTLCCAGLVLAFASIALSACAKQPTPKKPKVELQCKQISAIVISNEGANDEEKANDLNISGDQIAEVLFPKLNEICPKIADQAWVVDVIFESKLDTKQVGNKITSTETKTAVLTIELKILLPNVAHTFKGNATMEISSKKVLDIGTIHLDENDKHNLITKAIQATINEALKVFEKK